MGRGDGLTHTGRHEGRRRRQGAALAVDAGSSRPATSPSDDDSRRSTPNAATRHSRLGHRLELGGHRPGQRPPREGGKSSQSRNRRRNGRMRGAADPRGGLSPHIGPVEDPQATRSAEAADTEAVRRACEAPVSMSPPPPPGAPRQRAKDAKSRLDASRVGNSVIAPGTLVHSHLGPSTTRTSLEKAGSSAPEPRTSARQCTIAHRSRPDRQKRYAAQ